ncbi:uncharacterized protein [Palaemon carinicauda]|uniref:uncharacterized protein n=1 Tax=Palaemon carinicauda TaxID=392227 RepID=UPI0035B5A989
MLCISPIAYLLLLTARHLQVEASLTGSYHRVTSSFPSDMSFCHLQTLPLQLAYLKVFICATYCAKTLNCRLFCIKGDECHLFKTWVSAEYSGTDQDFNGFTSCYTSWYFSRNLAPRAVITMEKPLSQNYSEYLGTNGYFCCEYSSCSITQRMANPWWKADLQATYTVSALIVKPRDDGLDFESVEIRLGNSPTIGENSVFSTYYGIPPPAGSEFIFKPQSLLEGRYLSFQSNTSYGAFSLCEVQIIEA